MSGANLIGLFDSGVGGISVMKEVRRVLPAEDLAYFADSAYCPYGGRLLEFIRARALVIGDFLVSRGAKLIVIASNTTSIAALDVVRERMNVPVVGVEPAVKPAVAATRNGKVGVLATGVTLSGGRFNALVERYGNGVEVYTQPCPGLVELVEAGRWEQPEAGNLLGRYLEPMLARGVDTIVLGCTHYPFLRHLVKEIAGPGIKIIDTGAAVARQIVRVLEKYNLGTMNTGPGEEQFFTSGEPEKVGPVVRLLWEDPGISAERVTC
jgi:glutamate racemase